MNQPRIELIEGLIERCERVQDRASASDNPSWDLAAILKKLLEALLRNEV